jgi:hypothetical protein
MVEAGCASLPPGATVSVLPKDPRPEICGDAPRRAPSRERTTKRLESGVVDCARLERMVYGEKR